MQRRTAPAGTATGVGTNWPRPRQQRRPRTRYRIWMAAAVPASIVALRAIAPWFARR